MEEIPNIPNSNTTDPPLNQEKGIFPDTKVPGTAGKNKQPDLTEPATSRMVPLSQILASYSGPQTATNHLVSESPHKTSLYRQALKKGFLFGIATGCIMVATFLIVTS